MNAAVLLAERLLGSTLSSAILVAEYVTFSQGRNHIEQVYYWSICQFETNNQQYGLGIWRMKAKYKRQKISLRTNNEKRRGELRMRESRTIAIRSPFLFDGVSLSAEEWRRKPGVLNNSRESARSRR